MPEDPALFERHASDWWNERSAAFRSLHRIQRFRMARLEEWCGPFAGLRVVDLGCGGGLFAEAIAARGARVIGIDRGPRSLAAARQKPGGARAHYVQADLCRTPLRSQSADLVLLADVVEHVDDVAAAVAEAARLLRPGGRLFVNTLNRTLRARLLAVTLSESLRLVPPGTHDPRKFVQPVELLRHATTAGLELVRLEGESPRILSTIRHWAIEVRSSRDLSVLYSALFEKSA